MRSRALIAALALVLVAAAGGWYFLRPRAADTRAAASLPAPVVADTGLLAAALRWPGARNGIDCESGAAKRAVDPQSIARRDRTTTKALGAIAAELAASAAPADHALGLYVQMAAAAVDIHTQFAQQNPQCGQDPSCGPREDAALLQGARPYLDGLAAIATASSDPAAYGLAYLSCTGTDGTAPGGCAQLSARQWAQIEPQNALPWLFVAGEASGQSQAPLVADAVFRASQAHGIDSHWRLYAKLLDASALQGQGVDVRNDVAIAAMGMAAATRFAPYQPVFAYCASDALADANRRQVCDDLANMLTEHADTTTGLMVGTRMGERLGWPATRLDALRARRDAYYQLAVDRIGSDPESCASLARQRAWIAQTLAYGETGASERAIAASGQTVAQLARRRRAAAQAQAAAQ